MTERRTTHRYEISLPVKIRAPAQTGAVTYDGQTRDISTRGVHFSIENDLNVGAELDLTVTLPAEVTGGTEVLVRMKSTVIRVEKSPANGERRMGVAALFKQYEFVRNESARP
jgi:c-di-GMP-binding flagellar brake protein YcgR